MSRALYRTHRSRSLDEVVGQKHITELLAHALKKGIISHAYLLTGPRGIGKTSVARILAHEINSLPYSDEPNLDIIEIDAASNRRIDDIRDLREKVRITPIATRYKVYIIDEVHMLTNESFNALLKTLEEPPEHVVFILATTEVHKVPATILSRTQRFHFRSVDEKTVADHLRAIADKEKIAVDDDALLIVARHGGGSFRDSISLLDQLSASGAHITKQVVETTLGLVESEQLESLIDNVLSHKTKALIAQLRELSSNGAAPSVIAEQLVRSLAERANEQPELFSLLDNLLAVPKAYDPFIKLTATLVRFCEAHKPRTAALASQPAARTIAASESRPLRAEPTPTPATPHSSPASQSQPIPEQAPAVSVRPPIQADTNGAFNWEAVLDTAKKHNPPLYSVLARANAEYADNILTLSFVYALHRKKLEKPQYHAQLSRLIHDVCAANPEICIKDGKTLSDDAASVAAIMGGGEAVNA